MGKKTKKIEHLGNKKIKSPDKSRQKKIESVTKKLTATWTKKEPDLLEVILENDVKKKKELELLGNRMDCCLDSSRIVRELISELRKLHSQNDPLCKNSGEIAQKLQQCIANLIDVNEILH